MSRGEMAQCDLCGHTQLVEAYERLVGTDVRIEFFKRNAYSRGNSMFTDLCALCLSDVADFVRERTKKPLFFDETSRGGAS